MEKEIELIRMSSTEIMEKVAAYKDEQIIILNQVNKVSETEQYSPIRADFFLAILCLIWGIERSGFFNGREKWAKGFENQMV